MLQVLLVDDSPIDGERVQQELLRAGLAPAMHRVSSAISMSEALERQSWDVVIASHNLSGPSATEALRLLRAHTTVVPFIIVSGHIGEENAVALIKSGADDLVMMDSLEQLAPAVERSLREAQKRLEAHQALLTLRESEAHFKAIAANLPGMVFVLEISADGRPKLKYVSDARPVGLFRLHLANRHGFVYRVDAERSAASGQFQLGRPNPGRREQ